MAQSDRTITSEGDRIVVRCGYDPALVADFRNLNGKWEPSAKVWTFDPRDRERVEAAIDNRLGSPIDELVTVRLTITHASCYGSDTLRVAGREVARRPSRDSRVRLGEGVVVLSGGFPPTGGSMKHPRLVAESPTVLEIRDLPRSLVASCVLPEEAAIELVGPEPETPVE